MINQQLLDYIKQQLAQGIVKEIINANLLSQGWQQTDVNEAFSVAENQNATISQAPQIITSELVEASPKRNKGVYIIVALIVLVGIILFIYLAMKSFKNKAEIPGVTETSYESNSTKYTAYQFDDTERKNLDTPCYTSIIPKSAKVESNPADSCSIRVTMPDTTMPYVQFYAIYDSYGKTVKEFAQDEKLKAEEEYKKINGSVQDITSVSLAGMNAYLFKSKYAAARDKSYYIELPNDRFYTTKGGKVIGFSTSGFDGDPKIDVFTKYYDLFLENLKFK